MRRVSRDREIFLGSIEETKRVRRSSKKVGELLSRGNPQVVIIPIKKLLLFTFDPPF